MDDRRLARWRLRTLRLAGRPHESPGVAVEGLLAVQVENYAQASWAVAARTSADLTEADLGRSFDEGAIRYGRFGLEPTVATREGARPPALPGHGGLVA